MKQLNFRPLLLAAALLIICLLPILKSGLYSDDIANFEKHASVKERHTFDFITSAGEQIESTKHIGRYTPGSFYLQEFVFSHFESILGYKAYVLICNLVVVASFGFLLFSLGQSLSFITLFVFFYLAEIQFRIQYHDAFTTVFGMYSLLSSTIFACAAFYCLFLKTGSKYYYLLALALCLVAILFSEEGAVLIPIIVVCTLFKWPGWKGAAIKVAPFLMAYCIYLCYVMYIRSTTRMFYSGVESCFIPAAMLNVLKIQMFGALPFANLYEQKAIPELMLNQLLNWGNMFSVILILGIGSYLISIVVKNKLHTKGNKRGLLLIIAAILFIVPAIILMPSVKYQSELWLGSAYLPVYLQNFGVAVFFAVIAYSCVVSARPWLKGVFIVLALGNIAGAASAFLFNSSLINVLNYNRSLPAEALCGAVKNGILSVAPAGSDIILTCDYIWNGSIAYHHIFKNRTGKDFDVSSTRVWSPSEDKTGRKQCFLLDCQPGDTIYTNLYNLDCSTGKRGALIASDTTMNQIRLYKVEDGILGKRN